MQSSLQQGSHAEMLAHGGMSLTVFGTEFPRHSTAYSCILDRCAESPVFRHPHANPSHLLLELKGTPNSAMGNVTT